MKRKESSSKKESVLVDTSFSSKCNDPDSRIVKRLQWMSNPLRLVGSAKQYFELLVKHKYFSNARGVIIFDSRINTNMTFKNKLQFKNLLQTFVLETTLFKYLTTDYAISNIENLIKDVENEYISEQEEGSKEFIIKCEQIICKEINNLILNISVSTYNSTYKDEIKMNDDENINYPSLQIELSYDESSIPEIAEELKYCRVRYDVETFMEYLKNYAASFIDKIDRKLEQVTLPTISHEELSLGEPKYKKGKK